MPGDRGDGADVVRVVMRREHAGELAPFVDDAFEQRDQARGLVGVRRRGVDHEHALAPHQDAVGGRRRRQGRRAQRDHSTARRLAHEPQLALGQTGCRRSGLDEEAREVPRAEHLEERDERRRNEPLAAKPVVEHRARTLEATVVELALDVRPEECGLLAVRKVEMQEVGPVAQGPEGRRGQPADGSELGEHVDAVHQGDPTVRAPRQQLAPHRRSSIEGCRARATDQDAGLLEELARAAQGQRLVVAARHAAIDRVEVAARQRPMAAEEAQGFGAQHREERCIAIPPAGHEHRGRGARHGSVSGAVARLTSHGALRGYRLVPVVRPTPLRVE